MVSYLVLGAGYGFAAAVQPGPMQSYLISQTLRHGWRRTLPAVFAPLVSDGPIIVLVLLLLSHIPAWWLQSLRFIGGAFVLYLAAGAVRAWRDHAGQPPADLKPQQNLLRATLINLLNPGPYLFWSLVTGPLLVTAWHEGALHGAALLVGFYAALIASATAILLLCAGAGQLGARINRGLLGLSAILLFGFGLYQIWSGVNHG